MRSIRTGWPRSLDPNVFSSVLVRYVLNIGFPRIAAGKTWGERSRRSLVRTSPPGDTLLVPDSPRYGGPKLAAHYGRSRPSHRRSSRRSTGTPHIGPFGWEDPRSRRAIAAVWVERFAYFHRVCVPSACSRSVGLADKAPSIIILCLWPASSSSNGERYAGSGSLCEPFRAPGGLSPCVAAAAAEDSDVDDDTSRARSRHLATFSDGRFLLGRNPAVGWKTSLQRRTTASATSPRGEPAHAGPRRVDRSSSLGEEYYAYGARRHPPQRSRRGLPSLFCRLYDAVDLPAYVQQPFNRFMSLL